MLRKPNQTVVLNFSCVNISAVTEIIEYQWFRFSFGLNDQNSPLKIIQVIKGKIF
jgi:hypothetical protein